MKSVPQRIRTHKFHFGMPSPETIMEWWREYPYSKPGEKGSDEEVADKVYGATGDGVADDTVAIQAALTASSAINADEDCKGQTIIAKRRAAMEAQMSGLGCHLHGPGLVNFIGGALWQQTMAGYKHYCPYCRGL